MMLMNRAAIPTDTCYMHADASGRSHETPGG